jgi:iron complex outermembrane receptor protein
MRSASSKFALLCLVGAYALLPLAAGAETPTTQLKMIIVTAQKRAQNLQVVPIAVTAVTSQQLRENAGFDFQQIAQFIPGLQFSLEGEDVNLLMRGYPGTGTPTGGSSPVALYENGILRQVTSEYQAVLTDVSSVQVARGPQGTLSGRNAFAGSVDIIDNPPEFGKTRFGFSSTLTNYSGTRDTLFFNLPIGEKVAARISLYRERRDGVIRNLQNISNSLQDRNNDYARLQVGFKPSDTFSGVVRLAAWRGGGNGSGDFGVSVRGIPINPLDGHTTAGVTTPWVIVNRLGVSCTDPSVNPNTASEIGAPGSSPPLEGGIPAAGPCNTPADPGPFTINRNGPAIRDIHFREINGQFNWEFAKYVELRGLFSYQDYKEYRQDDGDYGPSGGMILSPTNPDNPNPGGAQPGLVSANEDYERTRTQELQLLSRGENKLQWVVGTFLEQNRSWNGFIFGEQSAVPGAVPFTYTPYNFNLNPGTLNCCGGPASDFIWYFPVDTTLRSASAYADGTFSVTKTWRVIAGARYTRDHVLGVSYFFPTRTTALTTAADNVFSHVTWRAGVQHDLSSENMLYFTASTGFIAGGANPGGVAPYEPQTDTSYELGSKNMLFGGSMRLNADVYYVNYNSLLVSSFNPATSLTTSTNAGSSTAEGLELDWAWDPMPNLRLRADGDYLRSKYGNFILGPEGLFQDGQSLPAKYGPGAEGFLVNGLTTRNAPLWSMNTSSDYDISLGDYGVLTPGINLTYVDDYRTWYAPNPWAVQSAYWKVDWRVRWTPPDSHWSAMFYMTNATNKAIRLFTTPNQGGIIYDQYMDPRIYGVRFSYRR